MEPFRILVISDSFHTLPEAVATLDGSGHMITYVHDLTAWSDLAAGDRLALRQAHAVVMGRVLGVNAEAFSLAPNLRVVALHTSGSDNVDLHEATRRGVLVTNVKGVNAEQCAEFAMGLMLSVVRQIRTGDRAIRAGLWCSPHSDQHGSPWSDGRNNWARPNREGVRQTCARLRRTDSRTHANTGRCIGRGDLGVQYA